MIVGFGDQTTRDIYDGLDSKSAREIPKIVWPQSRRKLDALSAAHELRDLSVPPGNRLKRLRGDLNDFYSIRVNDQYRVIFKWSEGNARDVRITDYHA
ncbi:MAG: type II toxin-antitoxin system RelE/ParE family toxin [Elusimicrobia bacterium]|nr:type II toxin-antitoxin system RelE/ParE family toxin [Candidatus Obscuribacterium magneticum]